MKYGDLTYEEIRDRAHQRYLAIVPMGCTEQQGPHLPVDFDTWFADQVCCAASETADRVPRRSVSRTPGYSLRAHAGAQKLQVQATSTSPSICTTP